MTTLSLVAFPKTDRYPPSIAVLDNKGNTFCRILADGSIATIGEDSTLFPFELAQITTVAEHFQLFYKNIKEAQEAEAAGTEEFNEEFNNLFKDFLKFLWPGIKAFLIWLVISVGIIVGTAIYFKYR